ncbi:2,3-bisphosphoglycerate-dependent phosphoglycerate mutase [Pseudonocardia acidicola]|uniref:2,3-bisphosphoglycerate-dependent phosphoglycerate mutase n=1 Tax=Pseudonocardia acidicola TaxID=2724939 RepID=A0ABX1S8K5_9PSEU|nr:2,3-bisphosphoglycerate-dependent phosphoglycerate mutase [Pseudonocardia acidicola]NMH96912.1 2,3-bisphosphoglycerate-dependent phosphoglycerate mutase [Pseudonocardia acidicola]
MAHACTAPAATLFLLRHGHSAGNEAGVFTGWLDAPLTARGRAEAVRAGDLLVARSCAPAVVHSSVLVRAIDTAEIVAGAIAAAGLPRPPVHRDWRLNERHYGALQGRGRAEVVRRYGADRFTRWRRGYAEVPPPLPFGHPDHPARDPRYAGLRAQTLPASESLADVRARLEPWWAVVAADLRAGGSVLVVGHSNSLRALCMLLDGLGEREVEALNVPTGVPLRYDLGPDLRPVQRGGVYLDPEAARAGIAEVVEQGRFHDGASA